MERRPIDPVSVPRPRGGYAQALSLRGTERLLFISGQIPEDSAGNMPVGFENQCHRAWQNVIDVLASDGMEIRHLVKVTTYLTDRAQADVNRRIRQEVLGDTRPALTVVVVETLARGWLLEIEAIAAI